MGDPGIPFSQFPEIYQDPDENTCVPVCIKNVLETMKEWVEGIPNISVAKIGEYIGTDIDGTPVYRNIENINKILASTIPQIKFETDLGNIRWKTIINDIHVANPLNTPVIAVIGQYDTQNLGWMVHSVVILYATNDYTYYWDPIYGGISEPTNLFFRKWDQLSRFCVRLKHVPRTQRLLEEYSKEKQGDKIE
jgi:hypothetical protein